MTTFVCLLRAVNVGGTGKLPMADLSQLCVGAGFRKVQTYIASGNVVLDSDAGELEVKARLEAALLKYAGKPIEVLVRSAAALAAVLADNPFKQEAPNRCVAVFLNVQPTPDSLTHISGRHGEQLALGRREIYIAYGAGIGQSKLKVPAAAMGTARNINTITRLVQMAQMTSIAQGR